jgi:hypothetical protein
MESPAKGLRIPYVFERAFRRKNIQNVFGMAFCHKIFRFISKVFVTDFLLLFPDILPDNSTNFHYF